MARSLQPPTPVRTTTPRASSREAAAEFARDVQRRGGVVVFTNGVFDLLHPGHVRYLTGSCRLGDVLIGGINFDRSFRANKGPERPINRAEERAEILLGLACVDAAAVFDEDTPLSIITQIQPDILVKGADWGPNNIVGRDVVEARGGRVVRVDLAEGFSTTNLIKKTPRAERQ